MPTMQQFSLSSVNNNSGSCNSGNSSNGGVGNASASNGQRLICHNEAGTDNNDEQLYTPHGRQSLKFQQMSSATKSARPPGPTLPPSPPDFDFHMPCRYFKSSFARSLSLSNASSATYQHMLGKSSDPDAQQEASPPLPQRPHRPGSSLRMAGGASTNVCKNNAKNEVTVNDANDELKDSKNNNGSSDRDEASKPPALPARRTTTAMLGLEPKITINGSGRNGNEAAIVVGAGNRDDVAKLQQRQQQEQQQHSLRRQLCNHSIQSNLDTKVWQAGDPNTEQLECNSCLSLQGHRPAPTPTTLVASPAPPHLPLAVAMPAPRHLLSYEQQQQHMENAMNVEAVILQNQVNTLKWQLKQVETSCEMYRAVMEEVARFFERYHKQKQQQQQQQSVEKISRCKSLYQVNADNVAGEAVSAGEEDAVQLSTKSSNADDFNDYQRARSSTNLSFVGGAGTNSNKNNDAGNASYTAFKDFTWRRSPKRNGPLYGKAPALIDDAEEKLSEEAFRLARTIHNLLNTSTQQPDLTQHRNSVSALSLSRLSCTTPTGLGGTTTSSLLSLPLLMNSTGVSNGSTASGSSNATNDSADCTLNGVSTHHHQHSKKNTSTNAKEMLFLRSTNMRNSRLSLRSSTDGSVVSTISSTSSSKVEEADEDPVADHYDHNTLNKQQEELGAASSSSSASSTAATTANRGGCALGSTTEDESGFSSISSFQDIGVPLSSTMISSHSGSSNSSTYSGSVGGGVCLSDSDANRCDVDNRNSTLKAANVTSHPTNIVGVPLRWDTAATTTNLNGTAVGATTATATSLGKTYRNANNKHQRFSTLSNEDNANTVLWV